MFTEREAKIREITYRDEGKRDEYFFKIPSNGLWIDPTYVVNRARYVNHSCRPNANLEELKLAVTEVRVMFITGIC